MTNKIRYNLLPGFSSNLDSFVVFQTVYSVQFPMTLPVTGIEPNIL